MAFGCYNSFFLSCESGIDYDKWCYNEQQLWLHPALRIFFLFGTHDFELLTGMKPKENTKSKNTSKIPIRLIWEELERLFKKAMHSNVVDSAEGNRKIQNVCTR